MQNLLPILTAALTLAATPLLSQVPRDGPGEIRFNLVDSAAITRPLLSQSTITFQPCASLTLEQGTAGSVTIDLSSLRSITFNPCGEIPASAPPLPTAPGADAGIAILISPNPLSSGATIAITVAVTSEIDLRILDFQGNVVRRFGPLHARDGRLELEWDTRDQSGRELPSGAYLIVVGTRSATTSRLLHLVR